MLYPMRERDVNSSVIINTLKISSQPVFTCSKLTKETLEKVVNFEHISHLLLVFLLLTLNM